MECINFIKNKENKKLYDFLKNKHYYYINNIFKQQSNIYDIAIESNNFEAFNILLDYDYNDCNCKYFSNILEIFVSEYLKCLLKKGFKISTNLINAIIKNKGNEGISIIRFLLQYISFSNSGVLQFLLKYYWNKTPLSQLELNKIVRNEKEKLNTIFGIYKSNIHLSEIPLIIACENEYDAVVKFLIEQGADINIEGKYDKYYSKTPLSVACERGNENTVKYLVEHGANVNVELKSKNFIETPLSIACKNGNEFIVKYLIENGADINAELQDYGNIECISCEKGNEAIMKYLIDNSANIEVELKRYGYITSSLSCYKNISIEYLIEHGAYINARLKRYGYNKTPLSIACIYDNESIVRYLIEHGANVNYKSNGNQTALSIACKNENESIIKYLIDNGADVNVKSTYYKFGNLFTYCSLGMKYDEYEELTTTPLIIACKNEDESIIKYLVEHGANINEKCNTLYDSIKTPLSVSYRRRNKPIIKYLIEHGADDKFNNNNHMCNHRYNEYNDYDDYDDYYDYESDNSFNYEDYEDYEDYYYFDDDDDYYYKNDFYNDYYNFFYCEKVPKAKFFLNGNEAFIKRLLDHGAPKAKFFLNGNEAFIKRLLDHGADVYFKFEDNGKRNLKKSKSFKTTIIKHNKNKTNKNKNCIICS